MISILKSNDRGHADYGWLNTYYSFSFADYHDPKRMGFRTLRVINQDRVQASTGFDTHPHRDMEIITYIIDGALEHRDSMGHSSVIRAGDVQRMSAGSGIMHSERNPSTTEEVHLLQIWIFPERKGITPSYDEKHFGPELKRDRLCPIATPDGREGSMKISQDASVFSSVLSPRHFLTHHFNAGRHGWLQLIRGALDLNGSTLKPGDAAAVSGESQLKITAEEESEFLLFDLG